jgi:hypothetical protein
MKIASLTAAAVALAACAVGGFAQAVPTRARAIRLQLTLTSASPMMDGAVLPYTIQEILRLGSEYVSPGDSFSSQIQEVSAGDPVQGLIATPAIGGWINLTLTKSKTEFAVKMIALLTKNGQPFGTRVSHLRFVGNPTTGAALGTCVIETFDLNGTLLMSASGTLSGTLVSIEPDDDYPDNAL